MQTIDASSSGRTTGIAAPGDGTAAMIRFRATVAAITKSTSIGMTESAKATPAMWADTAGSIEIEKTGRSACRATPVARPWAALASRRCDESRSASGRLLFVLAASSSHQDAPVSVSMSRPIGDQLIPDDQQKNLTLDALETADGLRSAPNWRALSGVSTGHTSRPTSASNSGWMCSA